MFTFAYIKYKCLAEYYDLPFLISLSFQCTRKMSQMKISAGKTKAFSLCAGTKGHALPRAEETLVTSATTPLCPEGSRRERNVPSNQNPEESPVTTDAPRPSRSANRAADHAPLSVKGKARRSTVLMLRLLCSVQQRCRPRASAPARLSSTLRGTRLRRARTSSVFTHPSSSVFKYVLLHTHKKHHQLRETTKQRVKEKTRLRTLRQVQRGNVSIRGTRHV